MDKNEKGKRRGRENREERECDRNTEESGGKNE